MYGEFDLTLTGAGRITDGSNIVDVKGLLSNLYQKLSQATTESERNDITRQIDVITRSYNASANKTDGSVSPALANLYQQLGRATSVEERNRILAQIEGITNGTAPNPLLTSTNDVYGSSNEYNQIMQSVNSLNEELQTVDTSDDISNISAKINALKTNISVFTRQIEILKTQIEKKEKELEELEKDLEKEQKTLKEYEDAFAKKEQEIAETDRQIEEQQRIIQNADQTTPEGLQEISAAYGILAELNTNKSNLLGEANDLDSKIQEQEGVVSKLQTKISNLKSLISALKTQMQSIETKKAEAESQIQTQIVKLIPANEMSIATEQGLDLTEKLPDGAPKYVIAQGKQDNQFHIYDMSTGASLARTYSEDGGYDIIPSGNGYISISENFGDDTSQGLTCYYLESCDSIGQFNACYCTSSPLSLDINGNGITTSSKVVNYDIDGDGIMDQINDSADAVLVFDKDGDGVSGVDASECFGDNTDLDGDGVKDGFKNGFEALKELAKQNNLINDDGDMTLNTQDIAFLEQNYGLKLKINGYNSEGKSLLELGITEINLGSTEETTTTNNFDGRGNQLMQQAGATFTINGETREYADIWHKKITSSDIEETNEIFGANTLNFSIASSMHTQSINSRNTEITSALDAAQAAREKQEEANEKLDKLLEEQDAKQT